MRTVSFYLFFASLLTLAACNKNSQCAKDQALVESLLKSATTAFGSGNIDQLCSVFADDAIILTPGAPSKSEGIDSIRVHFKEGCKHITNFQAYPGFSKVTADMVQVSGMFTFDWQWDTYKALCKGSGLWVWKKQADNSWKITYMQENHGDLVKK